MPKQLNRKCRNTVLRCSKTKKVHLEKGTGTSSILENAFSPFWASLNKIFPITDRICSAALKPPPEWEQTVSFCVELESNKIISSIIWFLFFDLWRKTARSSWKRNDRIVRLRGVKYSSRKKQNKTKSHRLSLGSSPSENLCDTNKQWGENSYRGWQEQKPPRQTFQHCVWRAAHV